MGGSVRGCLAMGAAAVAASAIVTAPPIESASRPEPVSVAAVMATYPVVFSTLPLRTALVVTTIVNLAPLTILLLTRGVESPNLSMAVAITLVGLVATPIIGTVITTSMTQRRQLALLVGELAATRAESARLSREAGTAAERERLAR